MRDGRRWTAYASFLQAIILSILIISPSSASAIAKAEFPDTYVAGETIPVNYYSANGTGVNPTAPNWGATETLLGRLAPATHDSEAEWMGLSDLPNPREISNTVCAQPGVIDDEMGLSDFNWLWGQFITHEIDFTLTQNGRVGFTGDPEHADIDIAEDDPVMGAPGGSKMLVFRSLYVNQTDENGTEIGREHPNSITTWIDASTVYG